MGHLAASDRDVTIHTLAVELHTSIRTLLSLAADLRIAVEQTDPSRSSPASRLVPPSTSTTPRSTPSAPTSEATPTSVSRRNLATRRVGPSISSS
jgi:hypothetical protein